MSRFLLVLLMSSALALGSCASKRPRTAPTGSEQGSGASASGVDSSTTSVSADDQQDAAGPQEGILAKRIVYFDFDSSDIRGEGADIVAAHAKHLSGNANTHIRLEGHTDERGSPEYNIGLGERRAQAVKRAMMLQGVGDVQVSTVSYGEERPAAAGSDESAWAQNRRVEIVYLAR